MTVTALSALGVSCGEGRQNRAGMEPGRGGGHRVRPWRGRTRLPQAAPAGVRGASAGPRPPTSTLCVLTPQDRPRSPQVALGRAVRWGWHSGEPGLPSAPHGAANPPARTAPWRRAGSRERHVTSCHATLCHAMWAPVLGLLEDSGTTGGAGGTARLLPRLGKGLAAGPRLGAAPRARRPKAWHKAHAVFLSPGLFEAVRCLLLSFHSPPLSHPGLEVTARATLPLPPPQPRGHQLLQHGPGEGKTSGWGPGHAPQTLPQPRSRESCAGHLCPLPGLPPRQEQPRGLRAGCSSKDGLLSSATSPALFLSCPKRGQQLLGPLVLCSEQ